jgi:hypothetical protein
MEWHSRTSPPDAHPADVALPLHTISLPPTHQLTPRAEGETQTPSLQAGLTVKGHPGLHVPRHARRVELGASCGVLTPTDSPSVTPSSRALDVPSSAHAARSPVRPFSFPAPPSSPPSPRPRRTTEGHPHPLMRRRPRGYTAGGWSEWQRHECAQRQRGWRWRQHVLRQREPEPKAPCCLLPASQPQHGQPHIHTRVRAARADTVHRPERSPRAHQRRCRRGGSHHIHRHIHRHRHRHRHRHIHRHRHRHRHRRRAEGPMQQRAHAATAGCPQPSQPMHCRRTGGSH